MATPKFNGLSSRLRSSRCRKVGGGWQQPPPLPKKMENIVTLPEDIPYHKATFFFGVLTGMGIDYRINNKSPLYRTLRERKHESYHRRKREREANHDFPDFHGQDYRVTKFGGKEEDIKLSVTIGQKTDSAG